MTLVPKCMSTQHPDNATPPPFAIDGVLKGEGEITEAVQVFELGCDEQMWDSEGKEADNRVVQKLLTNYPDFFQSERRLGEDCMLTLRVPNPAIETEMRKSLVEALQSIPSAWDVAKEFYGESTQPPIQEVILPFTTSAEELALVEAYYRKFIAGHESQPLAEGQIVSDWIGEFYPKQVRVIPLIEDLEHMVNCDKVVGHYLRDRDLPYQRVFLARSDPALNYGLVPAELMLKIGLNKLSHLEDQTGIPIYPIVGVGSVPFRGHLNPTNVQRTFREHPSVHTLTVQSAFKYDYDTDVVRDGIQQILAHKRSESPAIDEERAMAIIAKCKDAYQAKVRELSPVIAKTASYIPKRRERKLHVGLFGYGRSLDDAHEDTETVVTLPRAIGFCAALYSIGIPPELLSLTALDADDTAYLKEVYPSLEEDLATALRYANQYMVKDLLGDEYLKLSAKYTNDVDRVHEGLTSAIWAALDRDNTVNISHYVEEAGALRRFLG